MSRVPPTDATAPRHGVRAKLRRKRPQNNATGLKRWAVMSLDGYEMLTPYAIKERRRRRALGKVQKQARKVNR